MKRLIPLFALLLALPAAAPAQDRVGYAKLDLIISRMPEYEEVGKQLEAYKDELSKNIDTKRAYAQQKFIEARDAESAGIVSDEKLAEYETELRGLEREIRQAATDADNKMQLKQNELMDPVIQKLEATIQAVAEAEGYTHVLNARDGTGTSIVLWGREDRDLTDRILSELGIPAE